MEWFRIVDAMDRHLACALRNCNLSGVLTNGTYCVCCQHATVHALTHPLLATPMHHQDIHDDDHVCVFCGNSAWYQHTSQPMALCFCCYPPNEAGNHCDRTPLDVTTFLPVPPTLCLDQLLVCRPMPPTGAESERLAMLNATIVAVYLDPTTPERKKTKHGR